MSNLRTSDSDTLKPLGIEILHSSTDVAETPPDLVASEYIKNLTIEHDLEPINDIENSAKEINMVVEITRNGEEYTAGILDIFTAPQLLEMSGRLREYLGTDVKSHLESLAKPTGYSFYVGKLATYYSLSDNSVTTNFGSFERTHTDPSPNAKGPSELNSHDYAVMAVNEILSQFDTYYQADLNIKLNGPQKIVNGDFKVWERGIAESQFLVLDYIRDLLSSSNTSTYASGESTVMTMNDIEHNLFNIISNRKQIVAEVKKIHPILAQQVYRRIDFLTYFTTETMHRGKMGIHRFRKEPDSARKEILRLEMLLIQAAAFAETRTDQADIPVLDI